ncbi:MAG: hypothetical protein JNJ95_08140 [Dechloromonas sp.]|nr:hypothetical protein [Dechloromonas sp.]
MLIASAIGPNFAAEQSSLGRLFLDPQQRAKLDAQRQRNPAFLPDGDGEASMTINGEVRSSNGRRTRWINGTPDWNGNAPPVRVPVGDTFNPSTGQRESVIGDGRIVVKRGSSRK